MGRCRLLPKSASRHIYFAIEPTDRQLNVPTSLHSTTSWRVGRELVKPFYSSCHRITALGSSSTQAVRSGTEWAVQPVCNLEYAYGASYNEQLLAATRYSRSQLSFQLSSYEISTAIEASLIDAFSAMQRGFMLSTFYTQRLCV